MKNGKIIRKHDQHHLLTDVILTTYLHIQEFIKAYPILYFYTQETYFFVWLYCFFCTSQSLLISHTHIYCMRKDWGIEMQPFHFNFRVFILYIIHHSQGIFLYKMYVDKLLVQTSLMIMLDKYSHALHMQIFVWREIIVIPGHPSFVYMEHFI